MPGFIVEYSKAQTVIYYSEQPVNVLLFPRWRHLHLTSSFVCVFWLLSMYVCAAECVLIIIYKNRILFNRWCKHKGQLGLCNCDDTKLSHQIKKICLSACLSACLFVCLSVCVPVPALVSHNYSCTVQFSPWYVKKHQTVNLELFDLCCQIFAITLRKQTINKHHISR